MTTGIVLTGGASRRMGTDKAFVVVGDRPMAVTVADVLWEGGCSPVECQGGDIDGLASLGLVAHADTRPGDGPVAAIADALHRAGERIVVAACDLPGLDAGTVRTLDEADAPVAVAVADGRAHLASVWSPEVLPALTALLERGDASYRSALEATDAVDVPVEPSGVRNVNRPDDIGS